MRRALPVVTVVVLAWVSSAAAAGGRTALRITVQAGPTGRVHTTTLRCAPASGSVAHPTLACRRLRAGGRALFAPTPAGTACTQIYGGPQTATVTGLLAGKPLTARFARRDGCEVARWSRVAFLLGPLPPAGP
jgi:subtilisin inhibitor-like